MKCPSADIFFNGDKLSWLSRKKVFRATSGYFDRGYGKEQVLRKDYRFARCQNVPGHGPVPEGIWKIPLAIDPNEFAQKKSGTSAYDRELQPDKRHIQRIPHGETADKMFKSLFPDLCEDKMDLWGRNRVPLVPYKVPRRFGRSGFYIHDSTKGFSSGCIETDRTFCSNFEITRRLLSRKVESPGS